MIIYNHSKGNRASKRKEEKPMDKIEKALRELAEAIESNKTVAKVTVTITLQKPKPDKAEGKS